MMRTAKNLAVFFIVLALCAGSLQAKDIEIKITAEVTYVDEYSNVLEGKINVGDIITGSYIYDSNTPDTNPLSSVGDYRHSVSPYGVYLSAGGFTFKTDTSDVDFLVEIGDNVPSNLDFYLFRSYNNLPLSNGVEVDHISWSLNDYSGNTLSSTELPATPPVLEDWPDYWYSNRLHIACGYKGSIGIWAEVTSAELVEPIEASVEIKPDTLNVQSKGRWISCRIRLPEPYEIADIEPNSVLLEDEIEPDWLRLNKVAVVRFSRSELQDMLKQSGVTGLVRLKVTGELTDGTAFEGTDIIRVTNTGGRK